MSGQMKSWEDLLETAYRLLESQNVKYWTFGGGSSLVYKYNHRTSKDVDIFLFDVQLLPYFSPRVSDEAESVCDDYEESSSSIKLKIRQQNINLIVAPRVTIYEPYLVKLRNMEILFEHPLEVLGKKFLYRPNELKHRDIFDAGIVLQDYDYIDKSFFSIIYRNKKYLEHTIKALSTSFEVDKLPFQSLVEFDFNKCVDIIQHKLNLDLEEATTIKPCLCRKL